MKRWWLIVADDAAWLVRARDHNAALDRYYRDSDSVHVNTIEEVSKYDLDLFTEVRKLK